MLGQPSKQVRLHLLQREWLSLPKEGRPYAPQQTQHTLMLRAFADQRNLVSRGVLCTDVICCCFFKLNSVKLMCGTDARVGYMLSVSAPPFSSVPAALKAPASEAPTLLESSAASLFQLRGLPRKPPGLQVVAFQSSSALVVVLSRSVMWRRLRRLSSWWLRYFWPPDGALDGRGELHQSAVCGLGDVFVLLPFGGLPTSSVRLRVATGS